MIKTHFFEEIYKNLIDFKQIKKYVIINYLIISYFTEKRGNDFLNFLKLTINPRKYIKKL